MPNQIIHKVVIKQLRDTTFILSIYCRGGTLPVLASLSIDWQDFYLLYIIATHLHLKLKIKYAEDFYFNLKELNFPNFQTSYIKPLKEAPLFSLLTWNLKAKFWTNEGMPVYVITKDGFHLILGANMLGREYIHKISTKDTPFTLTKLPQLSHETHHIVTRHALAYPASFDPLLPLDFWSWILSIFSFLGMSILLIISHQILRPIKIYFYFFTDFWRDVNWFKTSSMLLFLWGFSFFLINNAYQIDFRTGLISQRMEESINSWNDVDTFKVHIYTFSVEKLSPLSKTNYFVNKNILEYDRHSYRFFIRILLTSQRFLRLYKH